MAFLNLKIQVKIKTLPLQTIVLNLLLNNDQCPPLLIYFPPIFFYPLCMFTEQKMRTKNVMNCHVQRRPCGMAFSLILPVSGTYMSLLLLRAEYKQK
jgi:hypothetical protein